MKEILLEQLQFCSNLPSLPSVALKIIDLAGKADTNLTQLNHYISLDPALAAKIVKTANSPLYKSRHQVSNISQAVSMLGMHGVMTIALSFSLMESLLQHTRNHLNPANSSSFWRRSITSALASRTLGKRIQMNNLLDDLFLAGLLQDIGILAFYAILPETYPQIFSSSPDHDALYKAEKEAFGLGHNELGAALLGRWKLPAYIAEACANSHDQSNLAQPGINECIAASGCVADYFLAPGEQKHIDTAIQAAKAYLGLDGHALMTVLEDMKDELHHVEELFEISIISPAQLNGIIEAARELLTMRTLIKVRELEDRVQHDGLTGAHNRAYFNDTFQHEFLHSNQNDSPLALAMIDIDKFKLVNDTHGHITGDGVLVAVVKSIASQIRQTDILCRYGGEEFALILPGTHRIAAHAILERIKANIAAIAYELDSGCIIHITASIGLAVNMGQTPTFSAHRDMWRLLIAHSTQPSMAAATRSWSGTPRWLHTLKPRRLFLDSLLAFARHIDYSSAGGSGQSIINSLSSRINLMNLIIQGLDIQNSDLRAVAKLAQVSQIERITGEAFRLLEAQPHPDIPQYCNEADLDYAFVQPGKKLTDFGLVAMDMDSTLLAIESIDEIAAMHNVKPQVSEITLSTMRGEINFAESLTRRTALLAGLAQEALQQVYDERLRLSPGAEKMLQKMQAVGIKTMVISGGFTFFTDRIKTRLGLDYAFANTLDIQNGKLTGKVLGSIIGASGKGEVLKQVRNSLGLEKAQVIAIGDGANDLKMLEEAGVGIAFRAKPILQEKATFSINHVGLDGIIHLFE